MTALLPPGSMYTASTIRFRDPFVSSGTPQPHNGFSYEYSRPAASSNYQFSRVLTPPPEMTGVSANLRPSQSHEQGHYYGNHGQSQVAPYHSYGQSSNRPVSPRSRQNTVGAADVASQSQGQSSQSNAIAPALQIPRAVNNSQGSLSELAAQVRITATSDVMATDIYPRSPACSGSRAQTSSSRSTFLASAHSPPRRWLQTPSLQPASANGSRRFLPQPRSLRM